VVKVSSNVTAQTVRISAELTDINVSRLNAFATVVVITAPHAKTSSDKLYQSVSLAAITHCV